MPESWALGNGALGPHAVASFPCIRLLMLSDGLDAVRSGSARHTHHVKQLTRCHWQTMQPSRYRRAGPAFDRDKLISLVRMAVSRVSPFQTNRPLLGLLTRMTAHRVRSDLSAG